MLRAEVLSGRAPRPAVWSLNFLVLQLSRVPFKVVIMKCRRLFSNPFFGQFCCWFERRKSACARCALQILIAVLIAFAGRNLRAQSTSFMYQGRLNDGGSPANGRYDLRFTVYDFVTNGNMSA